jgi:hypothetical protein
MGEEVRLREPDRKQLILETVDYEKLVGAEHPVARDLAGTGIASRLSL